MNFGFGLAAFFRMGKGKAPSIPDMLSISANISFLNAYSLTKMAGSTIDVPICQEQVCMNQGIASLFFVN